MRSCCSSALARTRSFRITAVRATFGGFPLSTSASYLSLRLGLCWTATSAGNVEQSADAVPSALDEAASLPASGLAGNRGESGQAGGTRPGERAQFRHVDDQSRGCDVRDPRGFETTRLPALPAAPAVPLEDDPAHPRPAAAVKTAVMAAHLRAVISCATLVDSQPLARSKRQKMMTPRPKNPARTKKRRTKLSEQETEVAVTSLMAGAMAHQRASAYCMDHPAKPTDIDHLYFRLLSFSLILMSVEQSLKLLWLLHCDIFRTGHAPDVLYGAILDEIGGKDRLRNDIVDAANACGGTLDIPTMDETEIRECLERHHSSYTDSRYFLLDKHGRMKPKFELKAREVQVLHCLALGLIKLNRDEIARRNLKIHSSMSPIPESEMTDELRAVKDSMLG